MKYEHINEIKGILVLALGLILFASLISYVPEDLPWYTSHPNVPAQNMIRVSGAYIAGTLFFIFGYGAYALVAFFLFWSWNQFTGRDNNLNGPRLICFGLLFCVISALISLSGSDVATAKFSRAGIVGFIFADFLARYCGALGAYIILFTLAALCLVLAGEFMLSPIIMKSSEIVREIVIQWRQQMAQTKPAPSKSKAVRPALKKAVVVEDDEDEEEEDEEEYEEDEEVEEDEEYEEDEEDEDEEDEDEEEAEDESELDEPNIRIVKSNEEAVSKGIPKPKLIGDYKLPPLDLLETPASVPQGKVQENLVSGAKMLEQTLANFGVGARVADIERGPVITRYELIPASGVRVQKFMALSDDIALAMKAHSVRIMAPIPGTNRVGIEVPNSSSAAVYLRDVLEQSRFQSSDSKLMLALGKDISGKSLVADLADMPHMLVAGTTGSGKSVCLNSIIMSILFNASPEEVKFLMVDPKMVELAMYNDIPHALCPTITDAKKVAGALNWVVSEMESRYKELAKAGVKNIKAYHKQGGDMPYIVVVIDEFADLMQVAAKTIESAVTRLAQLARAVGIHLILATQRPSVNVITGVIKANFPARVSFKVASKVDSRTVLDANGAQDLLGKGDMLFMKPGDPKPTRGQCCYVSDEEIVRVIEYIKAQGQPEYDDSITTRQSSAQGGSSEEKDELYEEAARLVIETGQASVSILQRRMRLGYTRAARLIDMMEQEGLVGPYCGSKPRDILVDREKWLVEHMGSGE